MPDMITEAMKNPKAEYAKNLLGQPALVTGGSSGIGKATSIGLGRAGAHVVVNYIGNADSADETAHIVEGFGGKAITVQADVSKEDEVMAMFKRAVSHFGTLHIVVSNAGLQADSPFEDMTLEKWNKVIGVNLTGQFLCMREAVKEFRRRGVDESVSVAAGKIISMSSVHQQIPWAGHVNYASSKGGIDMLMRSVAQEVAPYRIRVNAIAPGAIKTPINQSAWETPAAYADLMKLVPYGRIGEPDDIAQTAAWLASDSSDYLTGATIFVDGGMTLYPGFATGG